MKYILLLSVALLFSACSSKEHCSSCGSDSGDKAPANTVAGAVVAADTAAEVPGAKEEISKIYSVHKAKLGKTCSQAAGTYCGKVTRDLNVTEEEVSCLWGKVFRTTKEALPGLDGTPCAKMIKSFAASPAKVR